MKFFEKMTTTKILVLSAIFFVLFHNIMFFRKLLETYPFSLQNVITIAVITVILTVILVLFLSLFSSRFLLKPVLISLFLLSSLVSCFMNSYGIIVDDTMIQNIVQTNFNETADLLGGKLLLYFLLLGVVPSIFIFKARIEAVSFRKKLFTTTKIIVVSLVTIAFTAVIFGKFSTTLLRDHRDLRQYVNPAYPVYSLGKYINQNIDSEPFLIQTLGADAKIPHSDTSRELIIFVLGEAVRSDRFSLNGYERETNPLLKKEKVFSFSNFTSCGTSTAVSVPCMFSALTRNTYSSRASKKTENLLDVLDHAGVNVLWRDNNTGSKGVAERITFEDFSKSTNNTACDVECRDEGMLAGLDAYINSTKGGDVFIVLHQMGNHGPAYYKRYPDAFDVFTPSCKTNQLENCTRDEISNAYDNSILYTDTFLSKVINFLKPYSNDFETAMVYVSDHGESLGENNLYLHGLPYTIAPDSQTHVPALMWFGESFRIDNQLLAYRTRSPYSHDHVFHTVLGLMEIQTSAYENSLDMLHRQL